MRKLSIIIIILIPIVIISVFIYKKTVIAKQDKISMIRSHHIIASYVPEILTSYEKFIGREKKLQQIEHNLNRENIVIITGRAGIGKSSCATEYGKRYKENIPIRYFNADSATKMEQQYRKLAKEMDINVDQQADDFVIKLVNNKLASLKTKILFIFDNVDRYEDIKEYMVNMPTNVQVIITTRNPKLIANNQYIVLEEFSDDEAKQYLTSSLPNRSLSEGVFYSLVKNIGTLPYDIKCIASYLLAHPSIDPNIAANDIGKKIKGKLFQEFAVSSEPLKQHIWKILQYASFLDPDFIGIEIINVLLPQDLELSSTALKKIGSLSLISMINNQFDQAGFKIHRKLQDNIQVSIKNHPEYSMSKQIIVDNLLKSLDQIFPTLTFQRTDDWQTAISLHPHVEKLLNVYSIKATEKNKINLANLYYKLARYYSAVNINYQQALKCSKIALEQRNSIYKNNHPIIADSYNVTGVIYRKIGNVEEALKHLSKGLEIRQQLYSGDHPDLVESFHTIGCAYNQYGETKKGLQYSQMALDMARRIYSSNYYEIGSNLNLVGIGYLDLGDFEKSLEYFKEGLTMFSKSNPVSYEKMAALQSNIAYNYNKLGKHKKALKYSTAAVNIFKKMYPDGRPRTIYSLDDLAESLIKTNKIKEGLEALHQALDLIEKFGMNNHCITGFVLHDLGIGYFKNKDYEKALKHAGKAVILRKELYSNVKHHHELAGSLHSLGDINLALKNKTLALRLYQEALTMYSSLSLDHFPITSEIKQKIKELI